jgi:hypothetical protein
VYKLALLTAVLVVLRVRAQSRPVTRTSSPEQKGWRAVYDGPAVK